MSRGAASVSSRADGSIALLGSSSTPSLGAARRAYQRRIHGWPSSLAFVLANGRGDSINVEVVRSTDSRPQLVEFFDDGVATLHDGFLVGSSSGVQMMGGLRPSERQTASIVLRIVAFARCLQFQVNRYATSCAAATPMWNASTVAFPGSAPFRTNSLARRVAASVRGRTEIPCSARSRRARRSGSPTAASSMTSCETRNW